MDIRAQVSMVFHLDKCIGCHTCSVACKNIWTDRQGAEYMWWNNVETKPGTGYPTLWEDQEKYRGGWRSEGRRLQLRATGRVETWPTSSTTRTCRPWTTTTSRGPTATATSSTPPRGTTSRPPVRVSLVTGKPMEIEAGPNWDDDLGGSPLYAENDPNLGAMTEAERKAFFQVERNVFFYMPRICNHCLNPACVASCPSGALYKRGEDGIVLVNQEKCRAWRMCVSGCPYKKVYYNWSTGKSEKCILCYPRQETGQAPACFHVCVGRIRYLGVLLYDADRLKAAAMVPDERLVDAQRAVILDPNLPEVIAGAKANGITDKWITAAQTSPIYKLVKQWRLALPLRPEFRTLPMLFYVPPLLPVLASIGEDGYHLEGDELFGPVDNPRLPLRYMARLFGAGNTAVVRESLAKLLAVRVYFRSKTVGDVDAAQAARVLAEANSSVAEAEEIFRLTTTVKAAERHAVPPYQRELPVEETVDPGVYRGEEGLGQRDRPRREF